MTKTRAAAYVRVSTEDQVKGLSLDAQRREISRYCENQGYELIETYADEGVSARTDRIERRPALVGLLEDAATGRFDVVVVHTIDRWARNVGLQRQALQRLGKAGVGFVSVTENFDFTTASGKLMLTMIGGFSEFFSDQLAVHISKAKREQAERGIAPGPLPFGYVRGPDGVPIPHPEEAEAVVEVFVQRAQGASHGETARWLNQRNLRTRTGRRFTAYATKDISNNAFYVGEVAYKHKVWPGQHRPLVDRSLFERVAARRRRRANSPRRTTGGTGVLQGIVLCAHCGSRVHSERNTRGEPRYRERHGVDCPTNGRSVASHLVDQQLAEIIGAVSLDDADVAAIAAEAAKGEEPNVELLRERLRRLGRAYADGAFDDAEYRRRRDELEASLKAAVPALGVSLEEARAVLDDFDGLWADANPSQRKRLLAPLIAKAYLDIDTKQIVGIEPQPEFRSLLVHAASQTGGSCQLLGNNVNVGLVETGEN